MYYDNTPTGEPEGILIASRDEVVRATSSNPNWWNGGGGKSLGDYIREAKLKA